MRHWVKTRPELASAAAGGGGVVAAPPSWPSPAPPPPRASVAPRTSLEFETKVHTKVRNIMEKVPTMSSTVESGYKRIYI